MNLNFNSGTWKQDLHPPAARSDREFRLPAFSEAPAVASQLRDPPVAN